MSGKTYKASCGCGNITYEYTTALAPKDWPVRTCDCEFCSKRNGPVHCGDPNGSLAFSVTDPAAVRREQHGTRTADFIICAKCDGYMGAIMPGDTGPLGVVNLEHLEDGLSWPPLDTLKWQGEPFDDRMARRRRNWTPVTRWESPP